MVGPLNGRTQCSPVNHILDPAESGLALHTGAVWRISYVPPSPTHGFTSTKLLPVLASTWNGLKRWQYFPRSKADG